MEISGGKVLFLAVLITSVYVYQQLALRDVFILLRGKPNIDSQVLKTIPNTRLVYKIKSAAFDHLDYRNTTSNNNMDSNTDKNNNSWNYAVLARGFKNDEAVDNYVRALQHFDFVEETKYLASISTKLDIVFNMYNMFLRCWGYVGTHLNIIPSRPFEVLPSSTRKCKMEDEAENLDEIHSISLLSVTDSAEMNRYRAFFLWKAFPAYDVELVYTGAPVTGGWSTFVVFKYPEYRDFCELITSKLYEVAVQHKYRSVKDSYGFVVTPI